jgi:hypothetical protein
MTKTLGRNAGGFFVFAAVWFLVFDEKILYRNFYRVTEIY